MSKEEIKSILIDLICDYDPKRWSNEDVYCKYANLLYDKIENSNYELKEKYLNIVHIDQMKQIADLEAKLAESEKLIFTYQNIFRQKPETATEMYEFLQPYEKKLKLNELEIDKLKQQLAEKDKTINELVERSMENFKQMKEWKWQATIGNNQDKISFAVEQLNQAKDKIQHNILFIDCNDYVSVIEEIDNQIEELKKEMK